LPDRIAAALDGTGAARLEGFMTEPKTPTKAQLAGAARQAARQAREAAALRENLRRRKAQSRAAATPDTPQPVKEQGVEKCR
jgi:hypothetical protein